ncbi:hypothetical protein [Hyphomonas pacifica]|uniref:hypothetical protein n=1 Tax=Hyphomonas pacifica TaxID=1280941 RepID=UPI000AC6D8E1|nr:hypothetical protein [Hyphomonas pacifica]
MMKRIIKVRVAAVAVAASALTVAPAVADPVRDSLAQIEAHLGADTGLVVQIDHKDRGHRGRHRGSYRLNEWGQTRHQERQLRRDAIQTCRAEINRAAWRIGYRDVDFDDDRRVRQIGPYGFRIRFDDVEFEDRRRDREKDVTCEVRRGHVTQLEGIPERARYGHGRGYDRGYRDGKDGHHRRRY